MAVSRVSHSGHACDTNLANLELNVGKTTKAAIAMNRVESSGTIAPATINSNVRCGTPRRCVDELPASVFFAVFDSHRPAKVAQFKR